MKMLKVSLLSLDDCDQLANKVAELAQDGDIITLEGDLGVGKTTFARFFIQSLTSKEETVVSPTFTYVQDYETRKGVIHHFDLYRLHSLQDVLSLGFEETIEHGIMLIEWPDRLEGYELPNHLKLVFSVVSPEEHVVEIISDETWVKRIENLRL